MPDNANATPTEPILSAVGSLHDIFCNLYKTGECEWYENPDTLEHWTDKDDMWNLSYCRKKFLDMAKQLEQETDIVLVSRALESVLKVVYNRR